MKKLSSLAIALISVLTIAASAQAQTPFFFNKQGVVAEYAIKGPDGTVMSYSKSTVTKIDAVDEKNLTISYNIEAFDANRTALIAPMPMTTVVKNGIVEMAPNTMGMEIEGTVPSYPADITVGREFEYDFTIKMMGVNATTKGKEKVVAREDVTTPAGTFDCFKIESDVTVNIEAMGQTQNVKTTSWISAGIGTVKMESRDGAGNLQMAQELISLK